MHVAVLGSSGFVGSHVARALEAAGHRVDLFSRATTEGFDLGDPRGLSKRLEGVEAVVHAAGCGVPDAPESILGWLEVAGTENAARAARAAGVRRFIAISSTDATLGDEPRSAASEGQNAIPIANRFGVIEKAKEEALISLGNQAFAPVILRAGFLYGEGELRRSARFVEEARREGGIRIVGRPLSFMPTTNIANLAHAALLATSAPRAAHGVYHILDRELSTQLAFFERYSEALGIGAPRRGKPLLVERLLARFGLGLRDEDEVLRRGLSSTLDGSRAKEDLDYQAIASVEDGMKSLATWVRSLGGADELLVKAPRMPGDGAIESLVRGSRD